MFHVTSESPIERVERFDVVLELAPGEGDAFGSTTACDQISVTGGDKGPFVVSSQEQSFSVRTSGHRGEWMRATLTAVEEGSGPVAFVQRSFLLELDRTDVDAPLGSEPPSMGGHCVSSGDGGGIDGPPGGCDEVSQVGCGSGQKCTLDCNGRAIRCMRAGTGKIGDPCSKDSDCSAGTTCVSLPSGSGICRLYCRSSADCAGVPGTMCSGLLCSDDSPGTSRARACY